MEILTLILHAIVLFVGGWTIGGWATERLLWKSSKRIEYIDGHKFTIIERTRRKWK